MPDDKKFFRLNLDRMVNNLGQFAVIPDVKISTAIR